MIGVVFAATVLFAQAAATAEPSPPTAVASAPSQSVSPVVVTGQKPAAADKGNELVCHSEPVLGTLFPKKICARREDIAERQRTDQAELRRNTALRPWQDPAK